MIYSDLLVWQKSMNLVEAIYRVTALFPNEQKFVLTSQIQRSAISIPSNIAEGHGRKSTKVFINHLSIAFGSLMELETQLKIADKLGYIQSKFLDELLTSTNEIGKMISGLSASLKNKLKSPYPLNPQS